LRIVTFIFARLMPIWIVLFALWGIYYPGVFKGWSVSTSPALGFVLFIMGVTLDRNRLIILVQQPKKPLLGSLGKWVIGPLVSLCIGFLFFGFSELFYGVVMAGIVPSGTSANLNSLIGKGDLTLSITMSAIDTIVGPLITPVLAKFFLGSSIHFDYFSFLLKMVEIVFLPLIFGIALQKIIPTCNKMIKPYASIISAISLYVVVIGVSSNASNSLLAHTSILGPLFLCVCLQIILQMSLGYIYAKLSRFSEAECRSILFEIGICNTALATVLANDTFGPLAALASMANMICNLTLGSLVAVILSSIPNHNFGIQNLARSKQKANS
jgi:BASS family bile acid:Na+ symporter